VGAQGQPPASAGRVDRARSFATDKVDEVQRRVPKAAVLLDTRDRFRRLNGPVLAGHLAFRTFLFLLPMAVFLVAAAGYAHSSGADVAGALGERVQLSEALSSSISSSSRDAADSRFPLILSGVVGLLFGAIGMTSALHYAFAQVWELPISKIPNRGWLLVKFVGVVLEVALALAVTAFLRREGPIVGAGANLVAAGFVVLAFLALSWMLPRRAEGWIWLVPGSVVGMVGVVVLHLIGVYYLPDRIAKASALYGSLGTAVALLFYLLILSNVIILSAFVNASWWDHHHPDDG
jgi:membrane protein